MYRPTIFLKIFVKVVNLEVKIYFTNAAITASQCWVSFV